MARTHDYRESARDAGAPRRVSGDVYDAEKRSAVMRAVKSRDTAPEIALRKALFARGFRYRIDDRALPGRPDLVFAKYHAVLFVHGCFWHGHDCPRGARAPKTNAAYWRDKVNRNCERDKAVIDALQRDGWHVFVSWECKIKHVSAAADDAAKWLESLAAGRDGNA